MRVPRGFLLCAMGAVLLAGCAKSNAPDGWRPDANEALRDPYGAWATVKYGGEDLLSHTFSGELIAISHDSLYVLEGRILRAVAVAYIKAASVESFEPNEGGMTAGVILGTLSTLSNGYYLVFTGTAWIIGGSLATGYHTREPIVSYPAYPLTVLGKYARFPQGLPDGLDRARVAPRGVVSTQAETFWPR